MKILETSCVPPAVDGGIPNVEYFLIKGLEEKGHIINKYFPKIKSMFITDFLCGLFLNKGNNDIVHCHTNIGWNSPTAFRTFHGCTAQGAEVAEQEGNNVLKKGIYFKINSFMENRSANTNKCIAVSDYTADAISKYYNVPRKEILTVHNGIDINKFYPCKDDKIKMRNEFKIPKNAFVVTWTGHFEFNKGIFYLKEIIDKCKENKNVYFVIRSSVKTEDIPEQYKWVLNTPQVKFLTHGLNMREFYNIGDVHLMTSTYDPMPLTVLEAMACGKAVIAPKSGGHAEVIQDGVSGFLVNDYHNTKIMANRVLVLEKNRDMCIIFSDNASKRILSKFTLDHMVQNYLDVYNKV